MPGVIPSKSFLLGLDDYPAFSVPGRRGVLGLGEDSLLLAGLLELFPGLLQMRLDQTFENRVLGQTHNIVDIMPIAPTQPFPAAKATVPAKDYLYLRPDLTKASDQEFENRTAVFGCVDLAGAKVGNQ